MNVKQLKELVELLLDDEQKLEVQSKLAELAKALEALVDSPQDPDSQVAVRDYRQVLFEAVENLASYYDYSEQERLGEIGADRYFGLQLKQTIEDAFANAAVTPAVVHQVVEQLMNDRLAYLTGLSTMLEAMKPFRLDAGDENASEVGFKIPRALFDNDLDGLIDELRAIKQIIRAFAEHATGSVPPIVVRQISTSDPQFFFGVEVPTLVHLAGAVSWALLTWKLVEQIRKLRAETAQIGSFTKGEVERFFGDKIRATVESAVAAKVKELVPEEKAGRSAEMRISLSMALESLLARIERGMTVEVRMLPPPALAEGTPDSSRAAKSAKAAKEAYDELEELRTTLVFPKPEANPVTKLPMPPGKDGPTRRRRRKSTKSRAPKQRPAAESSGGGE
jgi:hypothetical protein